MWRAATAVAQRHRGGASRCDPAPDVAFRDSFEPHRPWPVAPASPPYSRRGTVVTEFRDATFDDNSVPLWTRGDFRGV